VRAGHERGDSRKRNGGGRGACARRLLSATALALFAGAVSGPSSAWAQSLDRRIRLSIGVVPVEEALRRVQRQTGVSIVFSPDQLKDRFSAGISGSLTPVQAVTGILRGTGLTLRRNGQQLIVTEVNPPTRTGDTLAAQAASTPPQQGARAPARSDPAMMIEEVVVTGSRLRTGFETATPVTMIQSGTLLAAAPNNVADALSQLPALGASVVGNTNSGGASGSTNGQSLMNLRNLGANRNLVLLNGRRVIATNTQNSVDINVMPQNLVSRIDIVTGGASAAYGSDAVAGVLNLVLDTDFVGMKGEAGGGVSSRYDLPNHKLSLAWGDTFAGERLHVIASTTYFNQNGTRIGDFMDRPWWDVQKSLIPNTTGSGPQNLIVDNLKASNGSDGGLIVNTLLRGTNFVGAAAVPMPFNYGYSPGTTFTSGGDGHTFNINFANDQWRMSHFVHGEYSLTDELRFYAEVGYSRAVADDPSQLPIETGARFQYTIYSENPFIPALTRAAMAANGITSFNLGRYLKEYEPMHVVSKVRVFRQAVGFAGDNLFDSYWNYDVSYSRGRSRQLLMQTNMPISRNMYAAADAVVHPVTGNIVCRSQYYDGDTFVPGGTGLDTGCRPINLFGTNSVAKELQPWTVGDAYKDLHLEQDVFAVSLSGDLGDDFGFDAGPISVATGFEYRTEKADQTVNPFSTTRVSFAGMRGGPPALNGQLGPYRFFNPQPFDGAYNVKEGFLELGIPLVNGAPWARALSTDLAVRYTDYSTSGGVTTWKVGGNYQPVPDIRFRGTVSRDIRAPNLLELFNTATQGSINATYPSSAGGTTVPAVTFTMGNPNLEPEKALTQTYGVVFTPTFFDGFQLSVDYYDIKIKGAIDIVPDQQTVDNCFMGVQGFCDKVILNAGALTILKPYLNLAVLENAGFDIEAKYDLELFAHPLQFSLLATHLTKSQSRAPGSVLLKTLGDTVNPRWRANLQLTYEVGAWELYVQERFIAKNLMDATKVEGIYVDENDVPAAFYTDVTLTYDLAMLGSDSQLYLTVTNVWDKMPPISLQPPTSFNRPTNRNVYEPFGRYFNMGLRFRF
jgi:outer membrane receptor protein involved in Fe transport